MNYITFDINIPDRCKPVKCVKNDSLTDISIHGERFLLLILTSGTLKFKVLSERRMLYSNGTVLRML